MSLRKIFIALALPVSLMATATVAMAGPPSICHPLDIGTAKSLPFTNDAFIPGDLQNSEVIPATLSILDESSSAVVHMETLRRAFIYVGFGKRRSPHFQELIVKLKERALLALVSPGTSPDRQALALFDVGFILQVQAEEGHGGGKDRYKAPQLYFAKATQLAPDNGEIALGAAISNLMPHEGSRSRFLVYMNSALKVASRQHGLLERNALRSLVQWDSSYSGKDLTAISKLIANELSLKTRTDVKDV